MKLTFSHARLKALWDEAVQQWQKAVRPMYGQRSPGFWLVGADGIYLTHNGARRKDGRTVAYANECDPRQGSFQNWLGLKRAVFGDASGMEFIEMFVIGTAVDAQCDIEIALEPDVMTVTVMERGQASLQWQSERLRASGN